MTWFIWISVLLLGALMGSFLNVVIFRGPSMWGLLEDGEQKRGNLFGPRSYCPACGQAIPAWRLFPVISYTLQHGRCAACHAHISPRYLLVELAAMIVAAVAFSIYGLSVSALLTALFGWTLMALAVIDWETGYLPDWLTLPLIAIGLLTNAGGLFVSFTEAAIGAVAGYVVFRGIAFLFIRIRNYEGLGQGDAKLLAAIGAWGGWTFLPSIVLAASLVTLAIVGLAALAGKSVHAKLEIPFGPGLCAAGFALFVAAPLFV